MTTNEFREFTSSVITLLTWKPETVTNQASVFQLASAFPLYWQWWDNHSRHWLFNRLMSPLTGSLSQREQTFRPNATWSERPARRTNIIPN